MDMKDLEIDHPRIYTDEKEWCSTFLSYARHGFVKGDPGITWQALCSGEQSPRNAYFNVRFKGSCNGFEP